MEQNDYGKFVLVDRVKGMVTWYENHESAVRDQREYGGIIINTETADPEFVKRAIDDARQNR